MTDPNETTFDPGAEAVEGIGPYIDVGGNRWATWAAYEKVCAGEPVIVAMVAGTRLRVTTATRDFEGHIFEVGRSPYHGDLTARLVDDEGRVHYFRPSRNDCTVVPESAW